MTPIPKQTHRFQPEIPGPAKSRSSVSMSGKSRGSLLLEAIIAIGVFAIFLGGIGLALILGERNTVASGDRTRAAFLAEQQFEVARMMRKQNWSSLTTGAHGVVQTGTGWNFTGTSAVTNGFRTSLTITNHALDWIDLQSRVTWNFGASRSGSIIMHTSLTNWRKVVPVGNWAAMTRIALLTDGGTPEYQKIALSGNYAYVTSTQVSGGKGLYIFDISNPASPVRVNSSFDLGSAAYGLAVSDNRLYLATDSASQEVQVFDITSPTLLALGNLVNSYDLPGTGNARSIAIYGENVFVGALDNPPNKQFFSLLMSETGPMTLQGSLAMSGSVMDLSLRDGYAYAATGYNVGEIQVVDIFDPANISFAPGGGVDMTDVHDGNAVAIFGTSALIGRLNGATIDELTLYSVADAAVPAPPPGPWTLEIGGDINALASVIGSKYAFAAGSASNAHLKVLDMIKFTLSQAPVVQTYDASVTLRGLFYDWQKDRLYGVSQKSFFVFAPG